MQQGLTQCYPRLWRYALVLTGNRDSAGDLAQATCARALENHDKFELGTGLDRWLFRIAQRIWLNDLRAAKVRRGGGLVPVEEIDLPSASISAETNFFVGEVLHSIYALPEAQRICVLLVYVEGFKYDEAAEVLEIPVGTIMSRLAAARKSIAQQLQDKETKSK